MRLLTRLMLGLLTLLLLLSPAWPARAQVAGWELVGFAGARVDAVAAAEAGRTLYLATDLGLQASFDGGENWHFVGGDLDRQGAPAVTTLALDPRDSKLVYAGTEPGPKGGLYRSRDGGQRWERLFSGERQDGVRALLLVPSDPPALYLGAYAPNAAGDRLFTSADGGVTWQGRVTASSGVAQQYFGFALGAQGRLLVASSAGVLRQTDNGRFFTIASTSQVPAYGIVGSDGGGAQPAYYASTAAGLIASSDGGSSWRAVSGFSLGSCQNTVPGGLAMTAPAQPIVFLGTRSRCQGMPARLMALVQEAQTRRARWYDASGGLPSQTQLRVVAPEPERGRVYALTDNGLWALALPQAEPTPDPAASASTPLAPPPDEPPTPFDGPVDVQEAVGDPEPSALGRWVDVAVWAVGAPVAGLFALRWFNLRRRSPKG